MSTHIYVNAYRRVGRVRFGIKVMRHSYSNAEWPYRWVIQPVFIYDQPRSR